MVWKGGRRQRATESPSHEILRPSDHVCHKRAKIPRVRGEEQGQGVEKTGYDVREPAKALYMLKKKTGGSWVAEIESTVETIRIY